MTPKATVTIHVNIETAEEVDRWVAALATIKRAAAGLTPEPGPAPAPAPTLAPDPPPAAEPATEPEAAKPAAPTKVTPIKRAGSKANGAAKADADGLSREDVRALLGKYADQYGLAAAVEAVKAMGVDHLDVLPVERLAELAAQLNQPPPAA